MALEDINYNEKDRSFVLELPQSSNTGTLSDIVTEPKSKQALVTELIKLLAIINYRRKVR